MAASAEVSLVPLSRDEFADLERLEKKIEDGQRAFVDVIESLTEIRDRRLYRASHKSFEAYCKDRFDFGRAHAYRLIAAGQVIDKIEEAGLPAPNNLSVLRPVLNKPVDVAVDVYAEATEKAGGKAPESSVVKQVAESREAPEPAAVDAVLKQETMLDWVNGDDADERAAIQEEESIFAEKTEDVEGEEDDPEAEFRAWAETMPAWNRIHESRREEFLIDLRAWKETEDLRLQIKHAVDKINKMLGPNRKLGPYAKRLDVLARVPHPRGGETKNREMQSPWVACMQCNGTGHVGPNGMSDCASCRGVPWSIPGAR